jgi:hypothetical protein
LFGADQRWQASRCLPGSYRSELVGAQVTAAFLSLDGDQVANCGAARIAKWPDCVVVRFRAD